MNETGGERGKKVLACTGQKRGGNQASHVGEVEGAWRRECLPPSAPSWTPLPLLPALRCRPTSVPAITCFLSRAGVKSGVVGRLRGDWSLDHVFGRFAETVLPRAFALVSLCLHFKEGRFQNYSLNDHVYTEHSSW